MTSLSRRSTFKEKLHSQLGDAFIFFQPLNRCVEERKTILIPKNLAPTVFQNTLEESQQDITPPYKPEDNAILSMVHITLQLRADIMSLRSHRGFSVSEDDAILCVPDSLYMLLRLIFGGQDALADWNTGVDDNQTQTKVLSVTQDVIYCTSGSKNWTPKHIGHLRSTLTELSKATDMAFLMTRKGSKNKSWTVFKEQLSRINPE